MAIQHLFMSHLFHEADEEQSGELASNGENHAGCVYSITTIIIIAAAAADEEDKWSRVNKEDISPVIHRRTLTFDESKRVPAVVTAVRAKRKSSDDPSSYFSLLSSFIRLQS